MIKKLNYSDFYTRLFNESKKREKLLIELEQKFYKSEEESCTFSPKINNIHFRYKTPKIPFTKEVKKIIIQESSYNNPSLKNKNTINIDYINNYKEKNFFLNSINNTKSIKVFQKYLNSNSFFYPQTSKNLPNEKSDKILSRNALRTFKILNNFHTNNENTPLNCNKLRDNDKIKETKYNLGLNSLNENYFNKKYNYLNNIENPNSNNLYNGIKTISYINTFNNICSNANEKKIIYNENKDINRINNFNKINNIEIENNNKDNVLGNINNFLELKMRKYKDKTFIKNNINGNKKEHFSFNDKKYISINSSENIFKKNKSNILFNKSDNASQLIINVNKEGKDYFKSKMLSNKNKSDKINDIIKKNFKKVIENNNSYNDTINIDTIENYKVQRKKINSFQKYKSNLSSDYVKPEIIDKHKIKKRFSFNGKENRKTYDNNNQNEINDNSKNIIVTSKRNKSINFKINKLKISSSFGKNSFKNQGKNVFNRNETYYINDLDDNLNNLININKMHKINKIPKIEYFYSFRNKKMQYNSFNHISNINPKTNKNKDNNNPDSNYYLNDNSKTSIKKNNKGICLKEQSNGKINIKNLYLLNNSINKIYSSDYNKKNYIINKIKYSTNEETKNKQNSKSKINNISYGKIIRHSINTNNTNNDTKGYSSSTISAKDIRTNSRRDSFQNKREHCKNNIENINQNSIKKQKIRQYIIDNYNKDNTDLNNKIINKAKKGSYKNNIIINDNDKFKITSKVAEDFFNNYKKQKNEESVIKVEKSMTLQSLSDSKMLGLAEHYINNMDDCLNDIGIKKILFQKKLKMEKNI